MENTTQTLPGGSQPNRSNPKPKTGCLGSTMIIILLLIILLPIGIWMWRAYNRMVTKEEALNKEWSNVNIVYERRAVIVDQLINTVRGSASFEKSTMVQVISARKQAVTNKEVTNDSTRIQIEQSQAELTAAIKQLLAETQANSQSGINIGVVNERYPDLKSPELFKKLMDDLNNIEREIVDARKGFINSVEEFNVYVRTFPRNLFASIFGFAKREYFKATPGNENSQNDASSLTEPYN